MLVSALVLGSILIPSSLGWGGDAPIRIAVVQREDRAATADADAVLVGLDGLLPVMRDLRRRLGTGRPVEVLLGAGTYHLDRPVQLDATDSGSADHPLVLRPLADEPVVLTGAAPIDPPALRWDATRRPGPPDHAAAAVRGVALDPRRYGPWHGLAERGFMRPRLPGHSQVLWRGHRLPLARWPDQGLVDVTGMPDGKRGRLVTIDPAAPPELSIEPDLWAFGFWGQYYAGDHRPVRLRDDGKVLELLGDDISYLLREARGVAFLENAISALDSPGEWWFDRETGVLWVWPPERPEPGDLALTAAASLLVVDGASHVVVERIGFEATRDDAVILRNVQDVVLRDCTIRNAGGAGIVVDGFQSGIERCVVEDTGDSAVILSGGDRESLSAGRSFVRDSSIRRFGSWVRTITAGVEINGVGNEIVGNTIEDGPHLGIRLKGNDHLIRENVIANVMRETDDGGGIYSYGNVTWRGTTIEKNVFCAIRPTGSIAAGVYLDAFISDVTVVGNLFYDIPYGVLINSGSDNVVRDNDFVGTQTPIYFSALGLDPGWAQQWREASSTFRRWLEEVPLDQPIWRDRYPELHAQLVDDPGVPRGNRIVDNRIEGLSIGVIDPRGRRSQTIEANSLRAGATSAQLGRDRPAPCARARGPQG